MDKECKFIKQVKSTKNAIGNTDINCNIYCLYNGTMEYNIKSF